MDPPVLTAKLASLAEHLGISVRFVRMEEGRGGIFALRGRQEILVNDCLPEWEKADVLAEILATFDLGNIYLLPGVREAIERYRPRR
ncbi:MAG: hypothetical protein AB1696_11310 [Planctomycetota bacterium]